MDDRIYAAAAEPGETTTVAGWVYEIRDLGGIAFLIVRDFIDAIEEGRKPMVPAREAREAVDVVLAAYESAECGERVALDEIRGV